MNQDRHEHHVSTERLDTEDGVEQIVDPWLESTYHSGLRLDIHSPIWTEPANISTDEEYSTFLTNQLSERPPSHYDQLLPDPEDGLRHEFNLLEPDPFLADERTEPWNTLSTWTHLSTTYVPEAQEYAPFLDPSDHSFPPRPCPSYADTLSVRASITRIEHAL